jgi:hypothetical protein
MSVYALPSVHYIRVFGQRGVGGLFGGGIWDSSLRAVLVFWNFELDVKFCVSTGQREFGSYSYMAELP